MRSTQFVREVLSEKVKVKLEGEKALQRLLRYAEEMHSTQKELG